MALSGCKVGPNYVKPPSAPPALTYKELPPPPGTWKPAVPADALARGEWWLQFGDPTLTDLETRLTGANLQVQAALANYTAAAAAVRQAKASFYPTLSLGPTIQRERLSYNRPNYVSNLTPSQYNDFALSGSASWQPDFWGQVRREVENARANAQALAADQANVELSVRTELAVDYYQLRGLDAQQQLLDTTLSTFQAYLELTQKRFRGGVSTEADVALAQTQLATTQTQTIDVAIARAQYQHAIATLLGISASAFSLPPMPQNTNIPDIPTGVPSELLERRPDVAAAERRAQAANEQIGVAIAAYYPNISLTGGGGFESGEPGTWIQGPSELWSVGASAIETIFDGGRRRAVTDQARANYSSTVANYRLTVLNSFQEVEDNLAALRVLQQEEGSAANAVRSATNSLRLSTNRYKGGVTTYLEVLTSQQAQLANQRTSEDITTRRFVASVQLVSSLGGGWNTSKLPANPK
ncbi:efflux transporter outer membrane subunit [Acidipila sp. EB88]|nr:efflux transporter outer membrane subunit [Acidipila sp. EB88]